MACLRFALLRPHSVRPALVAAYFLLAATPAVPAPTSLPAPAAAGDVQKDTSGSAAAFLVRPYLQLPTQTGITVMWETNRKLSSRLEFGTSRTLDCSAELPAPTILHEVRLLGLKPGTTYYYRVRSGDLVSEVHSFKTAPLVGTRRWRMAVYGDSRSNPAVHHKVAEQIAKANVDLIVHTGDIVLNGKNHWSWRLEFFQPLGRLAGSVPWVSTIGNHERDADNYFSYMALPGNERYFGFDYANAHIVCLDSNAWIEKGRDSKQFQWLADHLGEKREATWTFVVFHHPLFSAHATRPINSLRWDWAPLLLDPDNHVDGVLTGHDHFYARNYRMGRLSERPQPGVFFLTTAGGGATLYRSKPRDYVATEKSIHHFTLFELDGDRVTISAIDFTGAVFDRYVLTKGPTPAQEFCAYEVEELRQFLRLTLAAMAPVAVSSSEPTTIDTRLSVPTRFRVPVAGQLQWQAVPGWKMKQSPVDFKLEPSQALNIPLQAKLAPGPFPRTPALTIAFAPGKFRNRTIELSPFKLAGPKEVVVKRAKAAPLMDGKLEKVPWQPNAGHSLLGLPPTGGRSDRVQLLADKDWVYLGLQLDDPSGMVHVKPPAVNTDRSRLVLFQEHVRLVLRDGEQTRTFALSAEQASYCAVDGEEDTDTEWQAVAGQGQRGWTGTMAIPRKLFRDLALVRMNVVHHRREGKAFVDYELCPTYGMGNDPDLLPHWKSTEDAQRFARLVVE